MAQRARSAVRAAGGRDRHAGSPRVLAVIKGLAAGGAETLLVNLARLRQPGDYELDVAYLLPSKDHLVVDLALAGAGPRCLGDGRPADLRWLLGLRRLLDGRYDVVHVHSPVLAAATRLLSRTVPARRRPRIVSTEHNLWGSHKVVTKLANAATFRLGDVWLAVSEEVRDSLPPSLRPRTEVVIHGVVLDDFAGIDVDSARAEARAELGAGPDDVVVLTIANLRATKGHPDLLVAARAVLDSAPSARFVVAGHGPMADELTAQRDALGLGDRFAYLGYRSDPLRLLAAADLFVLPSHHEGYPIALMEAIAAGLPVVATEVGGSAHAVEDNGVLVPPRDPDALAAAIVELVGDPARRAAMSERAPYVAKRFDLRDAASRLATIYRRLSPGR
jgi:glycosyltransferase involved in cell wall biosynthesis